MQVYYWETYVKRSDDTVGAGHGSEEFASDDEAKEALLKRFPKSLMVVYTEETNEKFRIIYENLEHRVLRRFATDPEFVADMIDRIENMEIVD